MEKSETLPEPVNLLVLAENSTIGDQFIEDLRGFLQNEKYEPKPRCGSFKGHTTFNEDSRQFQIISGSVILGSDTINNITWKSHILQENFIQPVNLNAIIFLMKPTNYERFLSVNLLNIFRKDDIEKIERNLIFIFVHDDPVSYQKSCSVDEDLWTVLERIRVDLLHTKTFHYHSRLNGELCNTFLQFVYKNKKILRLETVYSHESVLKLVRNEDFLDLLLEALFLNEDNIHNKTIGKEQYYLEKWNDFKTVCNIHFRVYTCCDCSKVKTECKINGCVTFLTPDCKCKQCKCSFESHRIVKYVKHARDSYQAKQQKKYRHTLITIIVTIDLFYKENNISVGQLYHGLMERIKKEARYSILETMYEYEMDGREKGITADECMKYIIKQFVSLEDLVKIDDDFKHKTLMAGGNLRVM